MGSRGMVMKCINCGESGLCLCWLCARPVIVFAVVAEIIRYIFEVLR